MQNTASIIKAARYGQVDRFLRAPELAVLAQKSVAVFGLGCIGAPSALEFARAGISRLWLMDPDTVDPSSTMRWPLGITTAGFPKGDVLMHFINANYPHTKVEQFRYKLGAAKPKDIDGALEEELLQPVLTQASLIYNATAEPGVQRYLADLAADYDIPYLSVNATQGGWGGEVIRIVPQLTAGCWSCLQRHYAEKNMDLPVAPEDKTGTAQAFGCATSTFTGAGFDILHIAAAGVRAAVSVLAAGAEGAYPPMPWDSMVIRLRDSHGGLIPPEHEVFSIKRHPNCPRCNREG